MTPLLAGLGLGLAGSLHCLAMCGPLVGVMAPVFGRRVRAGLWYHGGRMASYAVLGIAAGLAGAAAGAAGLGRSLSIVAGLMLLVTAFGQVTRSRGQAGAWMSRQLARGLRGVAHARSRHPALSAAGAGAVNGLLPCGLVYAAALAASTAGGIGGGVLMMLAFGAGTLPAMLGVWTTASLFPAGLRRRLRLVTPAVVALVGLALVLRGVAASAPHVDAHAPAAHPQITMPHSAH